MQDNAYEDLQHIKSSGSVVLRKLKRTDFMAFEKHIIQYPASYSLCLGCQSCDLVCSLIHDGVTGPTHGRIRVEQPDYKNLQFHVLACQQCGNSHFFQSVLEIFKHSFC